jgi:acetyl esterase/lipase
MPIPLLLVLVAAMTIHGHQRPRTFDEVAAMPGRAPDARVAYGEAPDQFGELRVPAGAGPHPVIVLIHGGCWRAAYDMGHVRALATALADEGYAVWAIEYRRVGSDGGGWPNTFLDVGRAVDHLRTLATPYHLDLATAAFVGHSAGGHLALWAASRTLLPADAPVATANPFMPAVVVGLAAITDLDAYASASGCGSAVVPLMGGPATVVGDRYAAGSPVRLPTPVPTTLIVGTADAIVPRSQADAYTAAAGTRVTVRVIDGAGHFDVIAPDGAAWDALRAALSRVRPSPS